MAILCYIRLYCIFFKAHAQNCPISTSGLKSDVIIVFLDPDFLYDAGIPTIREHLRQKLAHLCLHGFSGPFGPKLAFWGQNRVKKLCDVDPNELVLIFGG